jgi:hypothetical protein
VARAKLESKVDAGRLLVTDALSITAPAGVSLGSAV